MKLKTPRKNSLPSSITSTDTSTNITANTTMTITKATPLSSTASDSLSTVCADPVVKEFPILFSSALSPYLFLAQHPIRSSAYPSTVNISAKVKPRSQLVQLTHTFPIMASSLEIEGIDDSSKRNNSVVLESTSVPRQTNYAVGILRDGQLHLTPIQTATLQFRPVFPTIDEADSKAKAEKRRQFYTDDHNMPYSSSASAPAPESVPASNDREVLVTGERQKTIQLQLKRRETAEQLAARQKSYSVLLKIAEEESWISCAYLNSASEESDLIFEKLIAECEIDASEVNQDVKIVDVNGRKMKAVEWIDNKYVDLMCPKVQKMNVIICDNPPSKMDIDPSPVTEKNQNKEQISTAGMIEMNVAEKRTKGKKKL